MKVTIKSRFDSYSVKNSVLIISHITFQDCRVYIGSDNLSPNSRIRGIGGKSGPSSSKMANPVLVTPKIVICGVL